MDLTPVRSSNIRGVGYDPASRELTVAFHDGRSHVHAGVSPEAHAALLAAPSVGKFYATHIKTRHPGRTA